MRPDPRPKIMMHDRGHGKWIARLSTVILAWLMAANVTAAEVSRGRQILLDRGLQIQGVASTGTNDIGCWRSANFTAINPWGLNPTLLGQMPAGQPWGRICDNPYFFDGTIRDVAVRNTAGTLLAASADPTEFNGIMSTAVPLADVSIGLGGSVSLEFKADTTVGTHYLWSLRDNSGENLGEYRILISNGVLMARLHTGADYAVLWSQPFTDTTNYHRISMTWQQASYTVVNLDGTPHSMANASRLNAFASSANDHCLGSFTAPWCLSGKETPYAKNLVSLQFGDELDGYHGPDILGMLPEFSAIYAASRVKYPKAIMYTNSPGFASPYSAADLAMYVAGAKPDMIMHDTYPDYQNANHYSPSTVTDKWYCRTDWYWAMQKYRVAGLAGIEGDGSMPIPYAQYINLFRANYSAPLPSESFVRLQQNASWAFGYTFLGALSYTDSGCPAVMFSSPGDNSPTPVFGYVAEANRQSRNLGPALVRLVSTDIRMIPGQIDGTTQPLPDGIAAWASGNRNTGGYTDFITSITQRGKTNSFNPSNCSDVLVGYFKPLLSDNRHCTFVDGLTFMIVNGSIGNEFAADSLAGDPASNSAEWFRIMFDFGTSGFDSLARLSRDTGLVELVALQRLSGGGARYRLDLQLDGGTGDLFRFWNSSNPLPTVPEPAAATLLMTGLLGLIVYAWRNLGGRNR